MTSYGRTSSRLRVVSFVPPWRGVESLPDGHIVEVLTVSGLRRKAILGNGVRLWKGQDHFGVRPAHCWSKQTKNGGDLIAFAWKPL